MFAILGVPFSFDVTPCFPADATLPAEPQTEAPSRIPLLPLEQLLTPFLSPSRVEVYNMGVSKIQIGQLWKQEGTGETYLVTRVYTEALSTMVVLRKSGAEEQALTRIRVERTPTGQTIPGFSPAQEHERF